MNKHDNPARGLCRGRLSKNISWVRDMFDRSYYLNLNLKLNVNTLANNKKVSKENALLREFISVALWYVRRGGFSY
ncbi:MAG: hypothetical protein AB1461_03655 [Thermodesulfobacteriota bacterium]